MNLETKLRERTAHAGVIGLGYVGLPLAVELAKSGYRVTGFEVDAAKAASLMRGRSYVGDVPDSELAPLIESGRLTATTDTASLAECDTVNICVPTPLRKSRDPDVSFIVESVEKIAAHLHPGMLVILESTTYPGTTEELIQPRLEQTGLRVGTDFHLAFSPERVDPGNPRFQTRNIPKVVGGTTPECTRLAVLLYSSSLTQVIPVSSPKVAEMAKLLENTYRSVNIGLVNELALLCDRMGIDVWEVIDAAATKPFGFMPFYPGPGLGGHCIPVDPFYLSWKARAAGFEARFIELAGQINSEMPRHVVGKIVRALNSIRKSVNGSRILLLGVAYKADVDDTRESPALDIVERLWELGAEVVYHDPLVERFPVGEKILESVEVSDDVLRECECAVVVAAHSSLDYDRILEQSRLVVDTRNVWKGQTSPKLFRL
ncbi:MAG: nucleotide sugar dehydrogenase [Candidatus Eisenbacteria bacterium]|nr:nucleotide sugar dehydrogenase [Candidatus Latescibacterota bacterium]MBD3302067.1 nucleotide sugar dehydrogenase [Candidatus Eisenbacteria bacterium]